MEIYKLFGPQRAGGGARGVAVKALLKYAFFLALALAIGFYIYGPAESRRHRRRARKSRKRPSLPSPPGRHRLSTRNWTTWLPGGSESLEGMAGVPATAHGSSVYAQSARAEVERLLSAEKALAPAAAELSNGAPPDARAASAAVAPALRPSE